MTSAALRLSVVVPCRNERDTLELLFERVAAVARAEAGDDWELILVDDGSDDDTWSVIEQLSARETAVRGIALTRNFGQASATFAGLEAAKGARVLLLDADLQDPPELLPEMMRALDGGAEVALGRRRSRGGEPRHRRLGAWVFYRLCAALSDIPIPLDSGDFRLMSRRFLDDLLSLHESDPFLKGLSAWVGHAQVEVPFDRLPRLAGETKYGVRSLMRLSLSALTGFSLRPLRLAWFVALCFALAAFVFFAVALKAENEGVFWILSALFFTAAVQSVLLAILGEYLGRMRLESRARPRYLIRERTSDAPRANRAP